MNHAITGLNFDSSQSFQPQPGTQVEVVHGKAAHASLDMIRPCAQTMQLVEPE